MKSTKRHVTRWLLAGLVALGVGSAARPVEAGGKWKAPEYIKMPERMRQGLLKLFRVPAGTTADNAGALKHRWQRGICGVVLGDKQLTQDFYLPGGPQGQTRPDSAPLRLRGYWLTDQGTKVNDAHGYLHPEGERAAGRWVKSKESVFDWLDRRWDLFQPHICTGSQGT